VKFKLDENLPVSAASVLVAAGHGVDTVPGEHLADRPDHDIVTAATASQRVLISLDVGLGDIRGYPPGSRGPIVILRLADQSAATVIKAIGDLASLGEPESLVGAVAVLQRGLLRIRHP
jgi:predicted nuclease of predicted toxin-antitoxin system